MSRSARRCDRCGKLYEIYYEKNGKYMDRPGYSSINGIAVVCTNDDGTVVSGRPKDLCPGCMRAFMSFIENKGYGKEEQEAGADDRE